MSQYVVTDTELTAVANAIRSKGGTEADLEWPSEFVSAIVAITTGGGGGTSITYQAVRVWTKSTGSYDAALYIQTGTITDNIFTGDSEAVSLLYTDAFSWIEYGNLIAVSYTNTQWHVKCIDTVAYDGAIHTTGDVLKEWSYNISEAGFNVFSAQGSSGSSQSSSGANIRYGVV